METERGKQATKQKENAIKAMEILNPKVIKKTINNTENKYHNGKEINR